MRAEQTVSEMALKVLERQAKALAERSGLPLEEALVEVLKTEPGGQLALGGGRRTAPQREGTPVAGRPAEGTPRATSPRGVPAG